MTVKGSRKGRDIGETGRKNKMDEVKKKWCTNYNLLPNNVQQFSKKEENCDFREKLNVNLNA